MVTAPLPSDEGSGNAPLLSYSEAFHKSFPYYLSIGMPYELYWDGEPSLVRDYREAEKLRQRSSNVDRWHQGLYIYDALCCVAPILNPFAKAGTKARNYPEQPYPIDQEMVEERKREEEEKHIQKAKAYMEAFAAQFNRKMSKKE